MSTGTLLGNLRPANGTGEAGHPGQPVRHNRYGLLLVVLLVSYLLSAFFQGKWVSAVQIGLFLGVSLIAFQAERIQRRTARPPARRLLPCRGSSGLDCCPAFLVRPLVHDKPALVRNTHLPRMTRSRGARVTRHGGGAR